jgi:taurine dioxygenase
LELKLTPLTGSIGALVEGADLHRPLRSEDVEALRVALHEWLVLFFPGQCLSDGEHIALAEAFGTPNINPNSLARGITHPLEWIEDNPGSPPKTDLWHTDVSFSPTPPDYAFLTNELVPERGGDTMWANLYAAYEALSPPMQRIADTLQQYVAPGDGLRETLRIQFGDGIWEQVVDQYQGVTHPLVRVHPDTGRKALFLCGAYFQNLVGFTPQESDALMQVFRSTLHDPGIQCRWRWTEGDLAIWDERCTNHRGLGDHFPQRRIVRRCTVGGSAPFGPSAPQG